MTASKQKRNKVIKLSQNCDSNSTIYIKDSKESAMSYSVTKVHVLLILFIVSTCIYIIHMVCNYKTVEEDSIQFSPYPSDNRTFLVRTPGCNIPKFDPFDSTVKKFYIKTSYSFHCGGKKSIFKITKNGGMSLIDEELHNQFNMKRNEMECYFYPILRQLNTKKPDDHFIIGGKHPLVFDLPIEDDVILIKCYRGNVTFFRDIIALTPIRPEVEKACLEKQSNSQTKHENLNIIIVGIDSVSKLNFLRYLKKSYYFLMNNLSAFELHGYNKVADNTYPNLIPFLTGHQRNYYNSKERSFKFFNDAEFVWKKFADLGYRTLYAEDAPKIGTFVLNRRGFQEPPTDYYTRPFALAVEGSSLRNNYYCIGSKLELEVYFDYLKRFVSTMENRPFFSFMFLARLTHDILKQAGLADKPSFELLQELHLEGSLNKSLLIFFSDHGIRFGGIRNTYIGKIEERMPFMFLVLPDWFRNKYPLFTANLKINERRLTTPYDIHATLLHLLHLQNHQFFTTYGQSLFTEVSTLRTCSQANVPPHWCVCQYHALISNTDERVVKAATATVQKMNKMLKGHSDICVSLALQHVLDARVIRPSKEFLTETSDLSDYLVTFSVLPSLGTFESTVHLKNSIFIVSEDISRTNRYGNQSHCLEHPTLRKYCFCKDLLANL